MIGKAQWIAISGAAILFILLYFVLDTKPKERSSIDQQRAMSAESASVGVLLKNAKAELSPQAAANVLALEKELAAAQSDTAKIGFLKKLSSNWYNLGQAAIAGHYAEEVATKTGEEQAWSIAGTTYSICVQRSAEENVKSFCTNRAIQAFENAISIGPKNVDHQLNLALVHTDNPPADNPMKGVLMLIDLNKKNPEHIGVLLNLGRLGIKTGQHQRAVERLEKVLSIDRTNRQAMCLLSDAYLALGDENKSKEFAQLCQTSL